MNQNAELSNSMAASPCMYSSSSFFALLFFRSLQYYPPDFDPSKLPRAKKPKDMKVVGTVVRTIYF